MHLTPKSLREKDYAFKRLKLVYTNNTHIFLNTLVSWHR